MNSKQLFLTTALITSLSSIAIAEVSISGEAKVNAKSGDYHIETDLTIIGKSGDTSVIAQLGLDNNNEVEQLYMTSKVVGIDIKVGKYKSGKGELGQNGGNQDNRVRASTSFGGVKLVYQDFSGAGGTWVAVAGKIGGVKTWLKKASSKTEAKLSGSIGGIDIATHLKDYDDGSLDSSLRLDTSVQGIELTYVDTRSDAGTIMDGFIGKHTNINNAYAFGVSTNILGSKITYKDIMIHGLDDKKLIITRKLSPGTTFEATYKDGDSYDNSLDLELAVKF
ncbi:MAG: hypothetical protein NZ811_04840 [Gammaproteobacteria bacterium]|nr:hypothetical protein [Gammaproteobacteria bacterium]